MSTMLQLCFYVHFPVVPAVFAYQYPFTAVAIRSQRVYNTIREWRQSTIATENALNLCQGVLLTTA